MLPQTLAQYEQVNAEMVQYALRIYDNVAHIRQIFEQKVTQLAWHSMLVSIGAILSGLILSIIIAAVLMDSIHDDIA